MDEATLESIRHWCIKGDHDLIAARRLLADETEVADVICFHAQQAVEKYLKAHLVSVGREIEKTHDLSRLLECCAAYDPDFNRLYDFTDALTRYAGEARYPDKWRLYLTGRRKKRWRWRKR